jgi:hypothetical protein
LAILLFFFTRSVRSGRLAETGQEQSEKPGIFHQDEEEQVACEPRAMERRIKKPKVYFTLACLIKRSRRSTPGSRGKIRLRKGTSLSTSFLGDVLACICLRLCGHASPKPFPNLRAVRVPDDADGVSREFDHKKAKDEDDNAYQKNVHKMLLSGSDFHGLCRIEKVC